MSTGTSTRRKKSWKIIFRVINVLLIIGSIVFGGFYFNKYNELKNNPPSSEQVKKEENKRIVDNVKKLYSVPGDEEPTIYLVNNKDDLSEELKKQEFFQKAVNGDYALVYEKAKIAILYRPSNNQLVDVRPLSVQNTLTIAIIGAQVERDATEKKLKDTFKNEVSIKTKNDAKASYAGYTVIDLTGKYGEQVKKIAEILKGQVGTLPAGEDKPDGVDILVISGSPQ